MTHLDIPVSKAFGVRNVVGDVGIEVELEYKTGTEPKVVDDGTWTTVPDGSLRHGLEYRLAKPISEKNIPKAINDLFSYLDSNALLLSSRTSVHVHMNMTKRSLRELVNVYSGYLLYENMLFATQVGRKSNHFCLRTMDAETVFHRMLAGIKTGHFAPLFTGDDVRYSGLNMCSLSKFGSIEYRFLQGMDDAKLMNTWASGLCHMTNTLIKLPAGAQIDLARAGMDALSMKVCTPELMGLLSPAYEKLSDTEKMAGLGYATAIAAALDACGSKKTEALDYVFAPNPDIDDTSSAKVRKKKTASIFGVDVDPLAWNEPPMQAPREVANPFRDMGWFVQIQTEGIEDFDQLEEFYNAASRDIGVHRFTNEQMHVFRALREGVNQGSIEAYYEYIDHGAR